MAATILLADHPNPWRDDVAALLREGEPEVEITDSGERLYAALADAKGEPRVVVIGQMLKGLGALEALYMAKDVLLRQRGSVEPPGLPRSVFVLVETRSDVELLDLLRQRGATEFLHREDALDRAVARILNSRFADRRPAPRSTVRISTVATLAGQEVDASMYDLSTVGAQIVLPRSRVSQMPSVGETVKLTFGVAEHEVTCKAEVRRLTMRKSVFGEQLVIGMQFEPLDADRSRDVEQIIAAAVEELEFARRG